MRGPAIWQNRRRRADIMVPLVLLWAPAWMIPAAIIGRPWSLVAGSALSGLPLLIGAAWLLWIVWRQADPVQRLLVALFLVFIIGIASVLPNWGPYPDQY